MRTTLISAATAALALSACGGDDFEFRADGASAYTRVDRMGMPAIATALITSKDEYNAADPSDDINSTFAGEIVASLTGIHAALDDDLTGLSLTPCDAGTSCAAQGVPLIIPDTLKLDLTQPPGFPNGRLLTDQVIDITLAVALLDLSVHGATTFADLPLNPPENDVAFTASFPYLASPN